MKNTRSYPLIHSALRCDAPAEVEAGPEESSPRAEAPRALLRGALLPPPEMPVPEPAAVGADWELI